jgi:ferredoxin
VSQIDPARCRGCGLCASECPAQAISVHHYLDEQIEAKIQGLFEEKGVQGARYEAQGARRKENK